MNLDDKCKYLKMNKKINILFISCALFICFYLYFIENLINTVFELGAYLAIVTAIVAIFFRIYYQHKIEHINIITHASDPEVFIKNRMKKNLLVMFFTSIFTLFMFNLSEWLLMVISLFFASLTLITFFNYTLSKISLTKL